MTNNIPEPDISPDFTMEDIRKIRDWNYERMKGMTPQEICEITHKEANEFLEYMANIPPDPNIDAEIERRLQAARENAVLKDII